MTATFQRHPPPPTNPPPQPLGDAPDMLRAPRRQNQNVAQRSFIRSSAPPTTRLYRVRDAVHQRRVQNDDRLERHVLVREDEAAAVRADATLQVRPVADRMHRLVPGYLRFTDTLDVLRLRMTYLGHHVL